MILALGMLGIMMLLDGNDCWTLRRNANNETTQNELGSLIVKHQLALAGVASIFTAVTLNLIAWFDFPAIPVLAVQICFTVLCSHISRELGHRIAAYLSYQTQTRTLEYGE